MKFTTVKIFSVATLIAGVASAASAEEPASPWSLSIFGGNSVDLKGSLRVAADPAIGDLGTVDPGLTGSSGTLSLDRLRYEDVFKRRFDAGLELAYSFNDNLQTYGRFSYEALDGNTRTIGELSSDAFTSPQALRARFSDSNNTSFELGSRYYWPIGTDWKSFAGIGLGATRLDDIRASIVGGSLDLPNVRFTRSGTVFSQTLETGVEYDPNKAFGISFSIDANHVGAPLRGDDPQLTALGINAGNNDAEARWSFPLSISTAYHF